MCLAEAYSLSIIKMPFTSSRLCFGGLNYLAIECQLAAVFWKSCQKLKKQYTLNTNLYPQPVRRHPHGPWPLVSVSKWVSVALPPPPDFPPPGSAPHVHDEVLSAGAAGGDAAVVQVEAARAAAAGGDFGGFDSGLSAAKDADDGHQLVATAGT